MSKNVNIETMKEWLTFIIAVVACIAGIIFWVQTINDPKFEELDDQITILREEISINCWAPRRQIRKLIFPVQFIVQVDFGAI